MSTTDPAARALRECAKAADGLTGRPYEISIDLPCIACGYNLRGLTSDGRCPECGAAIDGSLDPRLLWFAPPAYVRTLALGLSLIFWGLYACAFAAMGVSAMFEVVLGADLAGPAIICGATLGLITMIGMWLFTTPCPPRQGVAPPSARRATRVLVLAALAYAVALLAARLVEARLPGGMIHVIVAGSLATVAALIELAYVGQLARRTGHRRTIRQTDMVFWTILACGVTFGTGLALGATGAAPSLVHCLPIRVVWVTAGATLAIAAAAWGPIQHDCRQLLLACVAAAEANWAAGMRVINGQVRPTGDPRDE
ncbi:MAG: hypothetical protein GX591_10925 [Planctomycetes bacterium]|nr:hypothetical protein [Planctomycetota bacterium]